METLRSSGIRLHPLLIWLGIDPATRPDVCSRVFASADASGLNYWLEIFFSAGIATFGLVLNSPAVIIGAMLISPLMGPIMAAGLALAAGDLYLGIRAILNLVASVVVAISFSGFLVWLLPFHSATTEIISRTNPNLLDMGVALLSGLAGAVLVSRSGATGSGVTALPGVAIAVALMPPLCAMGFGLGSGPNLPIMAGAGLLFLTNIVAIVASAFVVFLLVGMSADDVPAEAREFRAGDFVGRALGRGPLGRLVMSGGRLRWRLLMIAVVLGSLAVPLRKALLQVADDAAITGIVRSELNRMVSAATIVSQQVQIEPDRIAIRVISTQPIPNEKIADVTRSIEDRAHRRVNLSVDTVASRNDLTDLLEKLRTPVPVSAPPPISFEDLRKQIADRVGHAVEAVWPRQNAPIQEVTVGVGAMGATGASGAVAPVLNVRYQATTDLDPASIEVILKGMRTALASPDLVLNPIRTPPPRAAASQRKSKSH